MKRWAVKGCIATLVSLFPVTAMLAIFYRFPIPLGGYASGPLAAFPSLIAMMFYGLFGAFPIAAVLGAGSGAAAFKLAGSDEKRRSIFLITFSGLSAFVVAGTLSILDKVIGPW